MLFTPIDGSNQYNVTGNAGEHFELLALVSDSPSSPTNLDGWSFAFTLSEAGVVVDSWTDADPEFVITEAQGKAYFLLPTDGYAPAGLSILRTFDFVFRSTDPAGVVRDVCSGTLNLRKVVAA